MSKPAFRTIAEQVAAHLRTEIDRGRWRETIPGKHHLAKELRLNNKTVEAALRQLEREGLLVAQGAGRKRRIVLSGDGAGERPLRVAILDYDRARDQLEASKVDLLHSLNEAGHTAFLASQSLLDLDMEVSRVARFVGKTAADAWVVAAGSREVLEWFSTQATPAFAWFGRSQGLPIAGIKPDKVAAYAGAVRKLAELGHRRIVLLCREVRRRPEPGRIERAFLDELVAQGIPTGAYNLPDWEDHREGFQEVLESLFGVTPPTALIIDEAYLLVAVQQFLGGRGLRVPQVVSLVCTDPDPVFAWCWPTIAHIRWDSGPVTRRILRWVANVSRGREDVRQSFVAAEYIPGGTVGPAYGTP